MSCSLFLFLAVKKHTETHTQMSVQRRGLAFLALSDQKKKPSLVFSLYPCTIFALLLWFHFSAAQHPPVSNLISSHRPRNLTASTHRHTHISERAEVLVSKKERKGFSLSQYRSRKHNAFWRLFSLLLLLRCSLSFTKRIVYITRTHRERERENLRTLSQQALEAPLPATYVVHCITSPFSLFFFPISLSLSFSLSHFWWHDAGPRQYSLPQRRAGVHR